MSAPLIECIPNFSEGRRLDIIDAIQQSIETVAGVFVLDRHIDPDHNRSVITFAGSPETVAQAAFHAIARAAELIDLNDHQGQHPRIGATDVVPFVPLRGASMEQCVELAHQLGTRVGQELDIPVYLYEKAAMRPDRVNLEDIRRGEYEGLLATIESDPDRRPDYGPARLGPAGATVIGARAPLVAYNVYLTTPDVDVARKIARTIRHSSGGLRHVKALGMLVEGRAQVSINLTDTARTPIAQVVEMIRREAGRYGVAIHHSELVGLIPEAALIEAARWYLQLDQFEPDQVLESRLYAAMAAETPPPFIEALAGASATPGGGSAAAYAGAMAAALVGMVARLTIGKKKYAQVEDHLQAVLEKADRLRSDLDQMVKVDAQAFDRVMQAYRLPKDTPAEQAERQEAIQRATLLAAEAPLTVARAAAETLELASEAAELGNLNAISDAASAGALAEASLHAAGLNVRINAASLEDRTAAQDLVASLEECRVRARQAADRIRLALSSRAKLDS
jgi:glutamate formiminotransferase / formiminotetrahydrofolate cyclodeaminase